MTPIDPLVENALAANDVLRLQAMGALSLLFRYHGLALGTEALAREFAGVAAITSDEIVRIARRQGLKARRSHSRFDRLGVTPLPAMASTTDGDRRPGR